MTRYILFADGGKKDGTTYGTCKLFTEEMDLVFHKQFIFGFGTSNSAEYLTLISALNHCLNTGITENIIVYMDSRLVVGQVMWGWKCNFEHLKTLRAIVVALKNKFTNFEMVAVTRKIIVSQLGH